MSDKINNIKQQINHGIMKIYVVKFTRFFLSEAQINTRETRFLTL